MPVLHDSHRYHALSRPGAGAVIIARKVDQHSVCLPAGTEADTFRARVEAAPLEYGTAGHLAWERALDALCAEQDARMTLVRYVGGWEPSRPRPPRPEPVFLPVVGCIAVIGGMVWIAYALAGGLGVLLLMLL